MTINISVPRNAPATELKPRITIIGVGGGGCNAVNTMIVQKLEGCDFVVANTDAQALSQAGTDRRIQLGAATTQGLGAGARPEIGRAAAEEALEDVMEQLGGSHMVFIAAGMGGGTGTGAAPVIARTAREQGILTVGVVTKPFGFEGGHRMRLAEEGIGELEQYVDTLIIIPNQNLFRVANEKTTFADAFAMADNVLYSGVRSVTDLMVMPGLINLDFADVRTVMSEMGKAMMGTGEAEGERRALDAAEAAISNPLLDDISMKGAKGVLISIAGGGDMTLFEVDEAANRIRSEVDENALINFGATFDDNLQGKVRVSVVATGIQAESGQAGQPVRATLDAAPARATAAPRQAKRGIPTRPVVETRPLAPRRKDSATSVKTETIDERNGAATFGADAPAAPKAPEIQTETMVASAIPVSVPETFPVYESRATGRIEQAAAAPAATPRAGAADAFIPGAPATARAMPEVNPEPMMQADLANAVHADPRPAAEVESKPKKKSPSLFERVTGVGRKEEPETAAPIQQTLSGVGSEDGVSTTTFSAQDDDMLDIPAFLRRQAN